jgi:hypothetical protein
LPKVVAALEAVRSARLLHLDPYLVSGYAPSENQLSDAIRMIIDPGAGHNLSYLGLESLLDAVLAADTTRKPLVEQLRAVLKRSSHIRVLREFHLNTGRKRSPPSSVTTSSCHLLP